MKKYILLFINLFIFVSSFNYSFDDFDIIVTPVNDYLLDDFDITVTPVNDYLLDDFDITVTPVNFTNYKISNSEDFKLPDALIYNLVEVLI
jgi:hypothetical protein